MKRFLCLCLAISLLAVPVRAEPIKWVDFQIPYESLKYAMDVDTRTFDQEKHIRWVDLFALAACRTGGKCLQSIGCDLLPILFNAVATKHTA